MWTVKIVRHSCFVNDYLYYLNAVYKAYFSSGFNSSLGLLVSRVKSAINQKDNFLSSTCSNKS